MAHRGSDQSKVSGGPAPAADAAAPAGQRERTPAQTPASGADVAEFVAKLRALGPAAAGSRRRLVFAMDATMSRQPTWDLALSLQSAMFDAVSDLGGLDVQLVYFRGQGECAASRWAGDASTLAGLMSQVSCRGGHTQIGKVLLHARRESEKRRVHALVFVGDAMEENPDDLCARAGELALLGVPVFLFQEGTDPRAEATFREIARLTRGAWCRFDHGAARQLRDLLAAVAAYASGGRAALDRMAHLGAPGARLLIERMR